MAWYGWILIGFGLGMAAMFLLSKNSINKTEITTRRIVQKKNTGSNQDVSNSISKKSDRNIKREQRKLNKALKRENNNH